jgi:hypothetical protein
LEGHMPRTRSRKPAGKTNLLSARHAALAYATREVPA